MTRLAMLLCLAACTDPVHVDPHPTLDCPGTMKPDGIGGCRVGPSPDAARCWRPDAGLPDAGTICWADGQPTEDGCRALGMAWSGTGCLVAPLTGAAGPLDPPGWFDRMHGPTGETGTLDPPGHWFESPASTASICVYGRHADGGCLDDSHDTRWCCLVCRPNGYCEGCDGHGHCGTWRIFSGQ